MLFAVRLTPCTQKSVQSYTKILTYASFWGRKFILPRKCHKKSQLPPTFPYCTGDITGDITGDMDFGHPRILLALGCGLCFRFVRRLTFSNCRDSVATIWQAALAKSYASSIWSPGWWILFHYFPMSTFIRTYTTEKTILLQYLQVVFDSSKTNDCDIMSHILLSCIGMCCQIFEDSFLNSG